ncbi:MAG: glycosyltransferase family 4 protein [Bryobacteraceae bacterium]|jgi:glycosyltransferase involved in cell wall biosynthesis
MRIVIADVQVPFIAGGAEALAQGLLNACREAGHEAERVTMPFRFSPDKEVARALASWESENLDDLNGYSPDIAICLRFPTYCLTHRRKVVWLPHQHRAFYDLWDQAAASASPEQKAVRLLVTEKDTAHLSRALVYTISKNVTGRLHRFNNVSSTPLYHPPPMAGKLYCAEPEAYIFAPSRLESLKRQWLLIQAMQRVRAPVAALISGTGGQLPQYERLIENLGLSHKVRLVGRLTEKELAAYYACSLGVFFGPLDEDYGYITLEAMAAGKPVITCSDSGGPLEFVIDNETGLVTDPASEAVADAIEALYANRRRAVRLGAAGYARYHALRLSWGDVVNELLKPPVLAST